MPRPVSRGAPLTKEMTLYDPFRRLAHGDDGNPEATVRALQYQLLMAHCLQVIAHSPDENKPPDNHEDVREPVAAVKARHASTVVRLVVVRVVVVRIWVLWPRKAIATDARSHGPITAWPDIRFTVHVEAVVDERDAETKARAILGRVRGVQEVGEEKADELKGRRDQGIPAKADQGSHRHSINVDVVGHPKARNRERRLPVLGQGVGGSLFV